MSELSPFVSSVKNVVFCSQERAQQRHSFLASYRAGIDLSVQWHLLKYSKLPGTKCEGLSVYIWLGLDLSRTARERDLTLVVFRAPETINAEGSPTKQL